MRDFSGEINSFFIFCFIDYLKPAKIYPGISNPMVSSFFRARGGSSASCYALPGRSLLSGGEGPDGHGRHHPRKNPQGRIMLLILGLVIIYLTEKSYFLRFLVCLCLDSLPA